MADEAQRRLEELTGRLRDAEAGLEATLRQYDEGFAGGAALQGDGGEYALVHTSRTIVRDIQVLRDRVQVLRDQRQDALMEHWRERDAANQAALLETTRRYTRLTLALVVITAAQAIVTAVLTLLSRGGT